MLLVCNGIYFVALPFFKIKKIGVFVLALTTKTVSLRRIDCLTVSTPFGRRRDSRCYLSSREYTIHYYRP
jgi:hypothetical protein